MSKVVLPLLCSLLASPAIARGKMAALLVPLDRAAEASTPQLEEFMAEALEAFDGYQVMRSEALLGLPPDPEAQAALRRAEAAYAEGRAAFEAKKWDAADKKLSAASQDLWRSSAAKVPLERLLDTTTMLASLKLRKNQQNEGRALMLAALALSPGYEPAQKRFGKGIYDLYLQALSLKGKGLGPPITLKSKPLGARVFIDGQFQGVTPTTLPNVPVGKHLLRLERPGHRVYGQVIDVAVDGLELTAPLASTEDYRAFDTLGDGLARVVHQGNDPTPLADLGQAFGLDLALLGTAKALNKEGGVELTLGLYDLTRGKKLIGRKAVFQGEEYGQLKPEVARVVNLLMNQAEAGPQHRSQSKDPLETKVGMEEWSGDDSGGKRTRAEQKQKSNKDPLQTMEGTEEW